MNASCRAATFNPRALRRRITFTTAINEGSRLAGIVIKDLVSVGAPFARPIAII
jgi:hypothetical protein